MSGQPAIVATDLSFSYGDHRAVDGVTFAVPPGEILGFLGPNGAGKSTTIKMLTGQLAPGGGTVEVLGLPMPARRTEIQSRIGVCFEEKNLYPAMSAAENLRFFARLFGIRGFDPAPLLERVGLAERAKDRVSDFSKGMRQRLMMARALVNTPDVLFLDEPTDGLDPVSARTIRALVVEETRRGAAVLLTTHDMVEADELSDRVAFINAGRVLVLDTPERLKLAHGERSVRVRSLGADGAVAEHLVPLDTADTAERIGAAVRAGEVLTVHTEEATLEDIFVLYAGRGLAS
ncbi:ABC transporter ATP-binding protein [Georgenia muralis]